MDLMCILLVDIEKYINFFVECVFNLYLRSVVIVVKYFCVFEEFFFVDKFNEMFFFDKMVMNVILFVGVYIMCGM